jgi:hypothetical protein
MLSSILCAGGFLGCGVWSGSATTTSPDHSYLALMELISGSPNISLLYFLIFFAWMTPSIVISSIGMLTESLDAMVLYVYVI